MLVVLNKDVPKLGYRGDTVKVKDGYFRNYLYPRRFADPATLVRRKLAEVRKEKMIMQRQQLLDNAKELIKKLKDLKVVIKVKISPKGKLYGAITENEIIEAVKEATNIKLEKEFIKMEHIKALGDYKVLVHLGENLEEEIMVSVKEK